MGLGVDRDGIALGYEVRHVDHHPGFERRRLEGVVHRGRFHSGIGLPYPGNDVQTMEIKGRDLVAGVPKIIEIIDEEIREALMEPVRQIVESVRIALERTPPELASDIVEKGIVLVGGGALLRNLDVLLREETGLPVTLANDPLTAVVMGAGKRSMNCRCCAM